MDTHDHLQPTERAREATLDNDLRAWRTGR